MRTYLGWEKVSALARHCFRSKCTQKSLGIGPGLVSGLDVARTSMVVKTRMVGFMMADGLDQKGNARTKEIGFAEGF